MAEAIVQKQGDNRLIAELPGVKNADQAIETIRSTGQLEFVDPKGAQLAQGMIINTTNRPDGVARAQSCCRRRCARIRAGTLILTRSSDGDDG